MNKTFVASIASLTLVLAACGGDSKGGGIPGGADSDKVVGAILDSAQAAGVKIDKGCLTDAVNGLPGADLEIMASNITSLQSPTGDISKIGISDDGMKALNAIIECAIGS